MPKLIISRAYWARRFQGFSIRLAQAWRVFRNGYPDAVQSYIESASVVDVDPRLEYVFTDPDGKRWYVPRNPMAMAIRRWWAMQYNAAFLDINVTRGQLEATLKAAIDAIAGGKHSEAVYELGKLQVQVGLKASPDPIIAYAAAAFLREDEDPFSFSDAELEAKIARFKNDATGFFLREAVRLASNYNDSLAEATLSYLVEYNRIRQAADLPAALRAEPSATSSKTPASSATA